MVQIDPMIKQATVAAVARFSQEGRLAYADAVHISKVYDVSVTTLNRWAQQLAVGETPGTDKRRTRNKLAISAEVMALIAHHGALKPAWRQAHDTGLFAGSYSTFSRACDDLDPAVKAGLLRGRDDMISRLPMMAYPKVARNDIWVLDHSLSDVRVITSQGRATIARPWVTIIKDKSTRSIMAVRYVASRPNATQLVSTFASAVLGYTPTDDDCFVGGLPQSTLMDNGGENTAMHLIEGLARLGTAVLPTTPGHSWQNGSAENIIRVFQRQFERQQPGYARAGKDVDGNLRFVDTTYAQQDPDDLLTLEVLQARALQWAREYNRTAGTDGNSPMQLWAQDDTEIETCDEADLRWAMSVSKGKYAVTKNGMYVNKREYQSAALTKYVGRGKRLTVRSFPGVTEWIETWEGDTFVCRAYLKSHMPVGEQRKVISRRKKVVAAVAAAERASELERSGQAGEEADRADDPDHSSESAPDALDLGVAGPTRRRTRENNQTSTMGAHRGSDRRDRAIAKVADDAADMFEPLPLSLDTP